MSNLKTTRSSNHSQIVSKSKVRDRALMLPLLGLVFLVPPVADIFRMEVRLAGIPLTVVYLFTIWALLIIGAKVLSRDLGRESSSISDDSNSE